MTSSTIEPPKEQPVRVATKVPPLSYSSSKELLGCQQKYVYRKVQKVDKDSDAPQDTLAMDIGSTLHKCLEDCNHDLNGFKIATLVYQMIEHNVPDDRGPMLWAMLRKYKELHEEVGFRCVATEVKLEDEDFIGYIDAILEDSDGGWWITDLKTAAAVNRYLPPKLPHDRQLNLYAHHSLDCPPFPVSEEKHLEAYKFKGCKYRVVTKSKIKAKEDESFQSLSNRMYKSIKAVEYTVPKEIMKPEGIVEDFKRLRKLQTQLWKKTKKPIRNYGYCDSYFRPCEYWSRCHGANYTDEPRVTEINV